RFNGVTPEPTAKPIPAGVFQLGTTAALAPTAEPAGDSVLYYAADNGHISSLDPADQTSTLVSATNLPHLIDAVWSGDTRQVIEVSAGKTGDVYKYYNFDTKELVSLGSNIMSAAFSPDGSRIVLAQDNGDETDIKIAQPDGSGEAIILKTKFSRVSLVWPSENTISLLADTTDGQTLYQIDAQGNITDLMETQSPANISWSPLGNQVLYSVASAGNPELEIYSLADKKSRELNFQANADQCAWSHDGLTVICAGEQNHAGTIVSINTADGSVKSLFSQLILTPSKVLLTKNENFLVLENPNDSTLYAFKLR
ncbi:MAG TPA: hypothetical protein VFK07_02655, partial [Candidatus Paceibacterota bacterium]|nr:hypothetical protein [Candidatus Paceibacterota bacterium]